MTLYLRYYETEKIHFHIENTHKYKKIIFKFKASIHICTVHELKTYITT
jgi:hypothetical protein